MNDTQRFKSEMFVRCNEYGAAETVSFPPASLGGKLFADLSAIVAELNTHSAKQTSGKTSAGQGTTTRGEARDNLSEDLEAMTRTARAIAEELPGIADKFRFPRGKLNDQELLAAARAALADAPQYKNKFIEYGLPADFIEDLQADIADFETAINTQETGRRQHVTATAAIEDLIERGMSIVRRLDAIVRNVFRDNPAKLAAWESARHVERTPRRRKETAPPAQ